MSSVYEFGVSLPKVPTDVCVVLAPPLGKQLGSIFIVDRIKVWKLDLTDSVLSQHRNKLGIPYEPAKKIAKLPTPSEAVLNYEFVHDHMKSSVNTMDYVIEVPDEGPPSLELKYTVNHVPCKSSFTTFTLSTATELMRTVSKELHRAYDSMHDLRETASAQGIDLTTVNGHGSNDISVIEKLQQADLRRANLSSLNPNARSKKVTKGFGSK